jgi:hypothetical protein
LDIYIRDIRAWGLNARINVSASDVAHKLTCNRVDMGDNTVLDLYNSPTSYCDLELLMQPDALGNRYFAGTTHKFHNLSISSASDFLSQSVNNGTIFGNLTLASNCQFWINDGFTLNLHKNLDINPGSFVNNSTGRFILSGSSQQTINCRGAIQSLELNNISGAVLATNLYIWSNLTITNGEFDVSENNYGLHIPTTFTNNGLFNSRQGTVYFSNASILGSSFAGFASAFYNIQINEDRSLTAPASNIYIKGNFINNGSLIPGSGTITFNGTDPQSISGSSATTFNNLVTDNTGDINMGNNISINNNLTMSSGVLNTGLFTVDLGASGTLTEASPNNLAPMSYVYGNIKATRNLVQNVANNFGGIGIEITETVLANNLTEVIRSNSEPAFDGSIKRKFSITPTTNEDLNATLVFRYFDSEILGTEAAFVLYKKPSGGNWASQPASEVNTAENKITLAGITSFSEWTASSEVPLPICLTYFRATRIVSGILLEWETASETNNDYFSIERSFDGFEWEAIHRQNGAGNSSYSNYYSYTDLNNKNIIRYYRLKQTDFDGSYEYSAIIAALPAIIGGYITVKPHEINLALNNFDSDTALDMILTDINGRNIFSKSVIPSTIQASHVSIPVSIPEHSAYILTLRSGNWLSHFKLIAGTH